MPDFKEMQGLAYDYVGAYEKAIRDVVQACGSREKANHMLGELHKHYEKIGEELRGLKREHGANAERHAALKAALLARARAEVDLIIDRYVPHTNDHIKELIMGSSLVIVASMLPVAYAVSTLAAATGVIAIGSSYYLGFKMLRDWKVVAGKYHVARLAGIVSPRHVGAHKKIHKWIPAKK